MHQEVLGWTSQSRTSGAVPVVMECDAHRLEAMEAPVPSWSRADNLTGADNTDKNWVSTVHRPWWPFLSGQRASSHCSAA